MATLLSQQHQKIGIVGLGRTGVSAYQALHKVTKVICYDQASSSKEAFNKIYGYESLVNFTDQQWQNLDKILLSPGIPLSHEIVAIANARNIPITSDIDLLFEEINFISPKVTNFIGITGTNGKSTTTSLIGHILQFCGFDYLVGGNIGIPVLDIRLDAQGYVLELSSFQLDLLNSFKAKVAILLNITEDHLDRHKNMQGYIAAKKKIFDRMDKDSFAIVNNDDEITKNVLLELQYEDNINVIPISTKHPLGKGVSICDNIVRDNIFESIIISLVNNNFLLGRHNQENIAASYAACRIIGAKPEQIIEAISSFKGLPHRMQYIGTIDLFGNSTSAGNLCVAPRLESSRTFECAAVLRSGSPINSSAQASFRRSLIKKINFYNDSKATNAISASKSISSLDNIYWLAGGIAKEGGIKQLAPWFNRIRKAYLFGQDKELLASTLNGKVDFQICQDLTESFNNAFKDAMKDTRKLKNILLAPACASFDQFKNFEERGELFVKLYNSRASTHG